ncbi:YcxB family protein [Cellulosilyticum ruminicola]|uniref:YcxB family protein n=1 Tax=Cellulosilyticum ruminicola TaxID=425254 RepID=UPI0006D259F4|nr:YcxB family protein [Cellulosilyticum ruminicola]
MSANKELTVDVQFKVKDILRYNMSVALKNILNKILMIVGSLVIVYFIYQMSTASEGWDVYLSQHIFVLLVPILIFVLIPWRVWQVTLTQMQMKQFAYGVTYIFTNKSVTLDIGEDQDTVSWDAFIKVVETKNDFRLYMTVISAQIIPKHNLTSEEIGALREMIKEAKEVGTYELKAK